MGWRGFGFVHHSRAIFCRAVPNPNITIRNFFIAVQCYESHQTNHCPPVRRAAYSDRNVANRDVRDSGWRDELTRPFRDARRFPLHTIVARSHMYTYAVNSWDWSLVQGPCSVAPCQTLLRFTMFPRRCTALPGCLTAGRRTECCPSSRRIRCPRARRVTGSSTASTRAHFAR